MFIKTQQENYVLTICMAPSSHDLLSYCLGNCYRIAHCYLVSLFWPGLLPEPQSIQQIYSG